MRCSDKLFKPKYQPLEPEPVHKEQKWHRNIFHSLSCVFGKSGEWAAYSTIRTGGSEGHLWQSFFVHPHLHTRKAVKWRQLSRYLVVIGSCSTHISGTFYPSDSKSETVVCFYQISSPGFLNHRPSCPFFSLQVSYNSAQTLTTEQEISCSL